MTIEDNILIKHYGMDRLQKLAKLKQRYIPMLQKIKQQESLSLMLLHYLSDAYDQINDHIEAESCYDEALNRLLPYIILNQKPKDLLWVSIWLYNLASWLLDKADMETSSLIASCALEWFPSHPASYLITGLVMAGENSLIASMSYLQKSLELCQLFRKGMIDWRTEIYEPPLIKEIEHLALINLENIKGQIQHIGDTERVVWAQ